MVKFEQERPDHIAEEESDPGRALFVSAQPGLLRPIYVPDIKNAEDYVRKCPPRALIDLDKKSESGETIKSLLEKTGPAAKGLEVNQANGPLLELAKSKTEHVNVDSVEWIMDPQALTFLSALLSQLRARKAVLGHMSVDRQSFDLGAQLDEQARRRLAAVAREQAASLLGDYWREFQARQNRGAKSRSDLEEQTRANALDVSRRPQNRGARGKKDYMDPKPEDFDKVFGGKR